METQKAMKFLMDLNDSYVTVYSNTLLLEHLPTVNKAYSLGFRHEWQVEVSSGKSPIQPEAAIFAVKSMSHEQESEDSGPLYGKCNKINNITKNCHAYLKCKFCGWKVHTLD